MGLKTFTIDFAEFSGETSNRFDVNFIDFNKIAKQSTYSFRDFFDVQKFEKKDRLSLLEDLDNDFYYVEIGNSTKQGNVIPKKLNLDNRNELVADYFKKIDKGDIQKAEKGNILLAKVRPNLKKYILIDEEKEKYFYTTAFINLKPKKLGKILYYLLRTVFYENLMAISRQGKGYPTLKEDDLFALRFDKKIIDNFENKQDQIVSQIELIEKKIKEIKAQIKKPQEIINKVFAREFGFDKNLYNEFGKGMTAGTQIAQNRKLRTFETDFNEFSRSSIFRFSTRFHNPPTKELMDFMDKIKTLKVKDIIKEAIHRGASPKYDQSGVIPVIKTGHLKNGYIEISEEEFVSEEFYNQKERSQVRENDVLLASTGKVSLGKIDLVETDEKLVVDGHISIIRIDENKYNPLFFTYFFRSILGFFQIERDYTGATNQIELYANEIEKFLIPDISLTEQKRIVNEIKTELDKQEEIKNKIESERNKIDEIIEKSNTIKEF